MALTQNDKTFIRLAFANEAGKLEEKFEKKLTKFKSDFFDKVDPILKEVVTSRDERTVSNKRLEKLEEIHPQGKHSFAS